jgi:hypothetical protein
MSHDLGHENICINVSVVLLTVHNIVTCGLRARIVETEETAVTRQRLGKHALAAADTNVTVEELLEAVVSM